MFKQIIFVLDAEQYFPESLVIGAAREKTVQQKAEAEKRPFLYREHRPENPPEF
jgi:hypothetical protein